MKRRTIVGWKLWTSAKTSPSQRFSLIQDLDGCDMTYFIVDLQDIFTNTVVSEVTLVHFHLVEPSILVKVGIFPHKKLNNWDHIIGIAWTLQHNEIWSTQFGLVCEKLPLLPLLTSTYMIGIIVATFTLGSLSGCSLEKLHFYYFGKLFWHPDHFGRRRLIVCGSLLHILASWAAWRAPVSWSSNLIL